MASYPPPPPPGYGPPPPGYGPPPAPYGVSPPFKSTHGKAIAALICGIVPFTTCLLPVGIAAVILAPQAKREIAAEPDRYEGAGLALAGQILGWIAIAVMVVGIGITILSIVLSATTSNDPTFESLTPLIS